MWAVFHELFLIEKSLEIAAAWAVFHEKFCGNSVGLHELFLMSCM